MSELLIFDKHDNLLTILSNEAEQACPFWDAPFKEVINQGSFFEFSTLGDDEDSKFIVAENQVAFLDKDGYFRLFIIKEPEPINNENGPIIRAICEPAMLELVDEAISDVRAYDTTLNTALTRALSGTRWKVGLTADFGLNSTNYYYINVVEAIQKIINTWGGEIRDRVEIKDNKIIGRYIDILPRRGADTGKRWEIDKDILSLSHKVRSYPKTALYGRGSSLEILDDAGDHTGGYSRKITFADVAWSKAKGDPIDKPLGQEWVGDPGALAVYGRKNEDGSLRHRFGFFESSDQEDPVKLLQETWDALQQQKRPVENYDMDVFLLEEITGHEHEKVRLGDTTFALDYSFSNPIETEERVVVFEYDVADPDNTGRVELGQYIDVYSDIDRLDNIESKLNDRAGVWDKATEPVTDDSIADIAPSIVTGLIASGSVKTIILEWDFDRAIHIANYEVFASQIRGFAPDPSNLVYRGKTSGYNFKANTDEVWYFRIRAINTHGRSGPYSAEVSASTVRVISDDLLFGPDIAAEINELSKTAELLSEQAKDAIRQPAIDAANAAQVEAIRQSAIDAANKVNAAKKALESSIAGKADAQWVDGQLQLKASKEDLENLKVGGRNLLPLSGFRKWGTSPTYSVDGYVFTIGSTGGGQSVGIRLPNTNLLPNTDYVLTFKMKKMTGSITSMGGHAGTTTGTFATKSLMRDGVEVSKSFDDTSYPDDLLTHEYTLILSSGSMMDDWIYIQPNRRQAVNSYQTAYTAEIWDIQIEEGNKATSWAPAPEDIFDELNLKADANNVYTIAQLDTKFDNTVSKTAYQADQDGIVKRFANAESRIKQTEDGLLATVSKTTYEQDKATTAGNISSLTTRMTQAESSIKANSDQIALRVTKQEFDDLQIGGRNLLRNSTFNSGFDHWIDLTSNWGKILTPEIDKPYSHIYQVEHVNSTGSTNVNNPIYSTSRVYLEPQQGDTITISFDYFCENASTAPIGAVATFRRFASATGGTPATLVSASASSLGIDGVYGRWIRAKYTYTFATANPSSGWFIFGMYVSNSSAIPRTARYSYREIKMEQGNRASGWVPAPEDLDASYEGVSKRITTAESSIDLMAGQISSKAESTVVNGLTGRVTTAEQNINAMTGEISQRVTKTEFENMAVGDRNLVLGSDIRRGGTAYNVAIYNITEDWETKQEYSVAIKGTIANGQRFGIWANGGNTKVADLVYDSNTGLHWATFTTPATITTAIAKRLYVYNVPSNTTEAYVDWIKLVRGNVKIADWTAAPEEKLDNNGNTVTSLINQTATTIKMIASKLEFGANSDMVVENNIVKIRNAAIGEAAIANLAVTRAKIGLAAIGEAQIEKLSITNSLIAANANIDGAKIGNATITDAKISTLHGSKIIADSIDVAKIKAGLLTGFTIQTDSVLTNKRIVMEQNKISILNGTAGGITLTTDSGSSPHPSIEFTANGQATGGLMRFLSGLFLYHNDGDLLLGSGTNNTVRFINPGRFPSYAADPPLNGEGTVYYNTSSQSLRVRTASGWKTL